MVSRSLSVLVTLIPTVALTSAFANECPEIQQAAFETWSVEQLCEARDNPEAWDEIERRDVFDRRELQALRRGDVRKSISEEALRCLKGSPETILPGITTFEGDTLDAFVYPSGTIRSLIVFVRREGDVSTVAAFIENAEAYMPATSDSAYAFLCIGRVSGCVPATGASDRHRRAHNIVSAVAASPPRLPSQ